MESLNSMQSFLKTRPSSFGSLKNAVEWWYVDYVRNRWEESGHSLQVAPPPSILLYVLVSEVVS